MIKWDIDLIFSVIINGFFIYWFIFVYEPNNHLHSDVLHSFIIFNLFRLILFFLLNLVNEDKDK